MTFNITGVGGYNTLAPATSTAPNNSPNSYYESFPDINCESKELPFSWDDLVQQQCSFPNIDPRPKELPFLWNNLIQQQCNNITNAGVTI
ncbi:MAG: hypothetical protein CR991_01630 [Proteobacteria bacterium]|nr:MAG: hypothetical protein CR991_01630 [Pseudomonadota bacterium]